MKRKSPACLLQTHTTDYYHIHCSSSTHNKDNWKVIIFPVPSIKILKTTKHCPRFTPPFFPPPPPQLWK